MIIVGKNNINASNTLSLIIDGGLNEKPLKIHHKIAVRNHKTNLGVWNTIQNNDDKIIPSIRYKRNNIIYI